MKIYTRTGDDGTTGLFYGGRVSKDSDLPTAYGNLLNQPGRLVFDRCFLSELVYGPIYRGHARLTYQHMTTLVRKVIDRRGVFVHVTAPAAEIRRRLAARGEHDLPSLDDLALICDRYDDLFRAIETMTTVLRISTSHPDEDT